MKMARLLKDVKTTLAEEAELFESIRMILGRQEITPSRCPHAVRRRFTRSGSQSTDWWN
jgi:hypothetical protein